MSTSRLLAGLIAGVVLGACGGGKAPAPKPPAGPTEPEHVVTSEPAALEAVAGLWELKTVNGAPLPFRFSNGVGSLDSSVVEVSEDGNAAAADEMTIQHKATPMLTRATVAAAGNRVTFTIGGNKTTMIIAGDTLTRVTSGDVYVYARADGPEEEEPDDAPSMLCAFVEEGVAAAGSKFESLKGAFVPEKEPALADLRKEWKSSSKLEGGKKCSIVTVAVVDSTSLLCRIVSRRDEATAKKAAEWVTKGMADCVLPKDWTRTDHTGALKNTTTYWRPPTKGSEIGVEVGLAADRGKYSVVLTIGPSTGP